MFYKKVDDKILLNVYLIPNARQDEIVGPYENFIKIKIKAPATENKANCYLIKWLTQCFHVPKNAIHITKGPLSSYKQLEIKNPKTIPIWLHDE